jgi:hypothetical protein
MERADNLPSDQQRRAILDFFLAGHGANHVAYLLDYEFDVDAVNAVIRGRLKELEERFEEQELDRRDG